MKKILSILIIVVALSSCESDVKFSDPGFQGRKDNFAWRADVSSAEFEAFVPNGADGYLTIVAYKGLESITLHVPFDITGTITKFNPVTYTFGPINEGEIDDNDDIYADYSYDDSGTVLEYSTEPNDGEEITGNVTIVLNEYDIIKHTISGTFKFNAKYLGESSIVPENVNLQEGVFYHVPIY